MLTLPTIMGPWMCPKCHERVMEGYRCPNCDPPQQGFGQRLDALVSNAIFGEEGHLYAYDRPQVMSSPVTMPAWTCSKCHEMVQEGLICPSCKISQPNSEQRQCPWAFKIRTTEVSYGWQQDIAIFGSDGHWPQSQSLPVLTSLADWICYPCSIKVESGVKVCPNCDAPKS
jgi:rubrerythrin